MNTQRFTRESLAGTVRFVRRASLKNIILPCTILNIIRDTEMKVRHLSSILTFNLSLQTMAKVGTVTSLTEELIKQLPDMDYSESHQDLFLKAVNILKELLNVLQTMEMCTDIDMKEEIQEEEEKYLEDGEIGLQSDYSQPHSPVVIKVKREQLNEEKESKLRNDEDGEDSQSDVSDKDFSSP